MSSLIPGYTYDIFISYRQKDNKYDGWVTEFVEHLKSELEATFKEEITVYFDINPHDGLLETNDVNASLREKLKCLVFIPIISRTYCDPRSFAWEHEFKAFIDEASKDMFGLMMKLPNGNVTSRILPIRIHDLDNEDIELCETVLKSVLRGVEFIYKSTGVNRPLRATEEKPQSNLNNTIYRDQINKVANAINDIIRSISKIQKLSATDTSQIKPVLNPEKEEKGIESGEKRKKIPIINRLSKPGKFLNNRWTINALMIFSIFAFLIALYIWPFLFKPRIISRNFESSVAVIAFDDISDHPGFENFAEGATYDLISRLTRIENLKVVPIIESVKYAEAKNPVKAICKENEVKMVLQGSIEIDSGHVNLKVELIDGEKDIVLWTQTKNGRLDNILGLQDEIVSEVARAINIKYSSSQIQKQVGTRPTKNFRAYELFLKGNNELTKWTYENLQESLTNYGKALDIDPAFIEAYANSALANLLISYFYEPDMVRIESIKSNARRTLALESDNETALMSMEGYYLMKIGAGQKPGILGYRDMVIKLKRLISKNPSSPMAHFALAEYYRLLKKDFPKASEYLKQSLNLCERTLRDDPSNGIILGIAAQSAGILGQIEFQTGHFIEAIKNTEYSIKLVPGVSRTYMQLSGFYFETDQNQKAREVLDQAISNVKNANDRGYIELIQGKYSMIDGKLREAEQYWAKCIISTKKPENPYYDYAVLYRCLMLYRLGNSQVADSLINNRIATPGINPWPESIFRYLADRLNKEEIISLAHRNWQKCEAFFFLGEKELIEGNLSEAKKHLEECTGTGVTNYLEYDMAQAELNRAFEGVR